jgi:hypothetical protein
MPHFIKAGYWEKLQKGYKNWLNLESLILDSFTFIDSEIPKGSVNGINTIFILSHTPISGSSRVYLNGTRVQGLVNYTISGNKLTFTNIIPQNNDVLTVDYTY